VNKSEIIFVIVMMILLPVSVLADPIKDSSMNVYKAGWYLNYHDNKLLTCPETCKASVNGTAESLSSSGGSKKAYLCKRGVKIEKDLKVKTWLFGNQFDDKKACYLFDQSGKNVSSDVYYCLCTTQPSRQ
jgi:hypothetical protein